MEGLDDLVAQLIDESVQVRYFVNMNTPDSRVQSIRYGEIDSYDFTQGFFELLKDMPTMHLYLDFDEIQTRDEMYEVEDWLNSLKPVFGNYSLGGYTNDEELSYDYDLKHIPTADHYVSIHVVYYQTVISYADLRAIMHHTAKKGFCDYQVHPQVDFNVYGSRRLMRHALSDKILNGERKVRAGKIAFDLPPTTQIITPRGNERIIEKSEWLRVFPEKEPEKKVGARTVDDLVDGFSDDLIRPTDEEMDEILNCFEPEFNNLNSSLVPLLHSPFSKEWLEEHLLKWYNRRSHSNGDACVHSYVDKYATTENSNKWFYSLIKKLPAEVADKLRTKYSGIDSSANVNESQITMADIMCKQYDIDHIEELLNDLKCCVAFCGARWFIDGEEKTEEKVRLATKNFKPFRGNSKINLYQVIMKYSNMFIYRSVDFSKDNKEGVINTFKGFKYQPICHKDVDLRPFLDHIKCVICRNDEKKYDYFMKWWANIFQNVTVKNGTMPIVYGSQGSGKSFPCEVFTELLGKYGTVNADDMGKVFGKFNALLSDKLVININEPDDATDKFSFSSSIKSKLTQKNTLQERKGIDAVEIESWVNFVLTTNHPNPVLEEKGNRRFIYYSVDNSKAGDAKYFDELCAPIQPVKQGEYVKEYMETLMWFMKNKVDVTGWNPEQLIREINADTKNSENEQLERQYYSLDKVNGYVVDNWEAFKKGVNLADVKIDGYGSKGIALKLRAICEKKRMTIDGNRDWVYVLKPREQIPDLWNIAEWKNNLDKEEIPEDAQ